MKVYYLNDERKPITVKIMDDTYDHTYTKSDNSHTYSKLEAQEGRTYDIICPEGSVLWVKKWPEMVMLSYCAPAALPQSEEQPPRSGAV
jgi:hypothetical protein